MFGVQLLFFDKYGICLGQGDLSANGPTREAIVAAINLDKPQLEYDPIPKTVLVISERLSPFLLELDAFGDILYPEMRGYLL